jgi:hypothetical protein
LPDEISQGCGDKYYFICECGKRKLYYFYSITSGNSASCGCVLPGRTTSSPAGEIYKFIQSITNEKIEFGYRIPYKTTWREYDIYIPSRKLAIEFHGLIWHSELYSKHPQNDYEKYILSQSRGDRLIQIYSDEWRDKKDIVKNYLRELISPRKKTKIILTYEVVNGRTPRETRKFLDNNCIYGGTSGCLTILARYQKEIVGAWVFQKKGAYAILRSHCWDGDFQASKPHQHALELAKMALQKMGCNEIIAYSDNRYETGELFEQVEFTFDKENKPTYLYTNGTIRCSKHDYKFKKKKYYRIWDSGKKQYSLYI